MTTTDEILVFKTNIDSETGLQKLAVLLDAILEIEKWSIDLSDCDRILRVKTNVISPLSIVRLTQQAGFSCEELHD
jgi:hypothetical protein